MNFSLKVKMVNESILLHLGSSIPELSYVVLLTRKCNKCQNVRETRPAILARNAILFWKDQDTLPEVDPAVWTRLPTSPGARGATGD